MKLFGDFLGRAPFVFLGVLGLFSIVGQFMTLEENIHQTLEAWRAVTRPIWGFLFGWLFEWIGWEMPWWVKDYLTMGLITAAGLVRALREGEVTIDNHSYGVSRKAKARKFIGAILVWPPLIAFALIFIGLVILLPRLALQTNHYSDWEGPARLKREMKMRIVLFETVIWALILIAANYAVVFSGAPTEPPALLLWV